MGCSMGKDSKLRLGVRVFCCWEIWTSSFFFPDLDLAKWISVFLLVSLDPTKGYHPTKTDESEEQVGVARKGRINPHRLTSRQTTGGGVAKFCLVQLWASRSSKELLLLAATPVGFPFQDPALFRVERGLAASAHDCMHSQRNVYMGV